MQDNYIFKTEDLVLKINKDYDHNLLKLDEWNDYIEKLSGNRYFQIEAIKNAIIYFASNRYSKIEDLVEENYNKNTVLKEKYSSLEQYFSNIQLKNKLDKLGYFDISIKKSLVEPFSISFFAIARLFFSIDNSFNSAS